MQSATLIIYNLYYLYLDIVLLKNYKPIEEFLLCAFAKISHLIGTAGVIDMPPDVRPVTGKSMRHALRTWFRDSTARFLSLIPSFRRKERKMPANFCFGLDAHTRPCNYFSPNFSLSSGAVYSTAEPHV